MTIKTADRGAVTSAQVRANVGAFVAAVLYGVSVVAVRVAVQEVPPFTLAFLRYAQGGVVLLVVLFAFRRSEARVTRSDLIAIAPLGVVFFFLFPVSFNIGLRFTEASRGALMLATMPIWSIWLSRFLTDEVLRKGQIAGVMLTVAGVSASLLGRGLAAEGGLRPLLGDALILLTAFFGGLYGALSQRVLARLAPATVTTFGMLIGAALLLPGALVEAAAELPAPSGQTVALVLFLGILGGAVAFSLWTSALVNLSPTEVAVYVNVNPMIATVLAVVLLGEDLTPSFLAGFVLVAGGVLLVNVRPRSHHGRSQNGP